MKTIIFVILATAGIASAQLSPAPTYCNDRVRPCVTMNSDGVYGGQIINVSSGTWALGYGSRLSVNGTSALTWTNAGVVTIPGTLSVTGGIVAGDVPAASISAGSLGSSVIASSIAVSVVKDSNLFGAISPAKITGTAAILGANSFTAAQSVIGSVSVSTSATSAYSLRNCGAGVILSTRTITDGCIIRQVSDNSVWIATMTVSISDNNSSCVGNGCYIKLSN